jgi:ElaB/YqjD/DUF883 family membrane-anchored ribosome-binding protein
MSETMVHSGNSTHLKERAVAVKDAVTDLAGEAGRFAKQQLGVAKESAGTMLASAKTKAEACNDSVLGFIRKRPYTSLGIAAGVGLTLGIILRLRRR